MWGNYTITSPFKSIWFLLIRALIGASKLYIRLSAELSSEFVSIGNVYSSGSVILERASATMFVHSYV